MKKSLLLSLVALLCTFFGFGQVADSVLDDQFTVEMTLEELMNITIKSASNTDEALSRAPATIIVISEKEIEERGYIEMYDVLNDLPGFDLSRAFGDDNYYLYARGYRKEKSDQMLLLVDGVAMNHLYNNNMDLFFQYPMSYIKQIEFVYGPASAIYGANAFAGVINIITKTEGKSTVSMHYGQNNTSVIDMNLMKSINDLSISFTGRLYNTDGYDFSDRTAALDSRLFNDTMLWGPFYNTGYMGYQSPMKSHFFKANVNYKGLTLGFINYLTESGYGAEYPGDKVLNATGWGFDDLTCFAKYEAELKIPSVTNPISSKTLLKYRQSGNPGNSFFFERYEDGGIVGVDASYWATTNQSLSFFQDFSSKIGSLFFLNAGLKYDQRILQKDYVKDYGDFIAGDSVIYNNYSWPSLQVREISEHKHFTLEDYGAYAQLKTSPSKQLDIITGLRYDYNSLYGGVFNPRVGAVYEPMKGLIAKLFYGQAYLEPSARDLYGGWGGSGSNSNLKPERIRTYEGSVTFSKGMLSNSVNVFYNQGYDVISNSENIGETKMMGAEYALKLLMEKPAPFLHRLKADLYVSYINSEENSVDSIGWIATGNMAPIKVKAIITANFTKDFSLSLQNRYISEIETRKTNPIDKIDAYFVMDAFVNYNNLGVKGLSAGLKVYNVLNTDYFHPGYRDAGAGEDLVFDTNGHVTKESGSDWYNSRLPQPLRTVMFNLRLTF